MDKVNYETYDTDAVYDDMDNRSTSGKVLFWTVKSHTYYF